MGRKAVLREKVQEALVEAKAPLSLTEVTEAVSEKLGRKVYSTAVLHALESLVESKEVKKELSHGRPAYVLRGRAFEESLSESISSLLTKEAGGDTSKALDNGFVHNTVPYVVYLTPQQDEEMLTKRQGIFTQVDWDNPAEGVASVLINDYHALEPEKKRGIAELVAWTYWCGIRSQTEHFIPGHDPQPLLSKLDELKKFLTGTIARAENEHRNGDTRADRAAYRVLEITENLVSKENLQDFLSQAFESRYEVMKQLSLILHEQGSYTGTGELIFDGLVKDINKRFQIGLEVAKVKTLSESLPPHMRVADGVWNSLLGWILYREHDRGALKGIAGTRKRSVSEVRKRSEYANDLAKLVKNHQVAALYVWGYPEVDSATKAKDQVDPFPGWLVALGEGRLDHRVWLFEKRTFRVLREALRAVREGKKPLPLRIDKEQWTLADVYDHYSKAKDVEFWVSLIDSLRERMGPRNGEQFRAAVPRGIYSEFKKKESRVVREILRKEEREVRKRLKSEKGRHEHLDQ